MVLIKDYIYLLHKNKMKKYNTTQLDPDTTFERHVYHRDQFAHYLRWTYVLKTAKIGMRICDFGCGTSMNLAEVFYRNRYKPELYHGLDIRDLNEKGKKLIKLDWCIFNKKDLCSEDFNIGFNDFDLVTSFEVIEHVGKQNADIFLKNMLNLGNKNTIFMLSTPVYDENVGAADNHTYDSGDGRGKAVQEFEFEELKTLLEKYFIIEKVFGTFASQKDYKPYLNEWQQKMFDELSYYYDSNLISNIMAPMFPNKSRNCLWVLKKK